MRKIVAAMNITQDGFTADVNGNLDWHFDYWDNQLCDSLCNQLSMADTILLGANTYRAMASYWPLRTNDLSMSKRDIVLANLMNSNTKAVMSKAISACSWQNTILLRGELRDEISLLKIQPGSEIIILGSGQLVSSLARLKLIDRYILWIHPVCIKDGKLPFDFLSSHQPNLLKTQYFNSGVVLQIYE